MSNLIPLARVALREPIAVPGVTSEGKMFAYPTHEEVLISIRLQAAPGILRRDRYELYLDRTMASVTVSHPDSGETEHVPLSMVKQYRILKTEPEKAK